MRDLPPGWAWTTLGEVAEVGARIGRTAVSPTTLVSFVPMSAVEPSTGILDPSATRPWEAVSKGYVPFAEGDILFARITPCMENGKVAMARGLMNGTGAGSTEFHVIRARELVEPVFLLHYLLQERIRRDARAVMQGAAGQLRVPATFLQALAVPLPPKAEQRRIVAEIEEQLTRLGAAIGSLRHAKTCISRLRTSVISSSLQWDSWPKTALSRVIERIDAGKNFRCNERPPNQDEVGVVKVSAVSWGCFDEDASKTCLGPDYFDERHLIRSGDFLISRANTVELVGACVIVGRITRNLMLSDKILRLILRDVEPAWLLHALRSPQGRRQIEARATGNQESMRNISQESIKAIETPLPSRSEQVTLLASIEGTLSRADAAEAALDAALARAARLRQAILKKAFEGKLVPQDPNDRPASVLLESIRTARSVPRGGKAHA